MKSLILAQLKKILRALAHATVQKYRPGIIAVTGSVGKTSTKEAIYTVLRNFRRTRTGFGTFNNELGVPLTILGPWQEISGGFFWLKVIAAGIGGLLKDKEYPEVLVLEYAADRPADLDYLIGMARPQIAVVTAVGDIPVHVEFYDGPEAVAHEKRKLVQALPAAGFAVLNFDDQAVLDMKKYANTPVFTFGFGEGAHVRITHFENRTDQGKPAGIVFNLEYDDAAVPVRIDNAFGKAQAYAAAAAACVGLGFGLNLNRIAEALLYYQPPPHRMRFLMGIKETYLIDDSYNASPLSMHAAIDTVKTLSAKRKIGILGDMLELGKYTIEAHETIGVLAARTFGILVTVGSRAKFIAEAALQKGMAPEKVISFDTAEEAKFAVLSLLKTGDLVLVKGSRAIGLDTIVEEIRYKQTNAQYQS